MYNTEKYKLTVAIQPQCIWASLESFTHFEILYIVIGELFLLGKFIDHPSIVKKKQKIDFFVPVYIDLPRYQTHYCIFVI